MEAGALRTELTAFLKRNGIPDAEFDVRCMFEQVTGKRLENVLLEGIDAEMENPLRNMVQRRACGEPLQYILGEWEFFGMRLFVGKGVLIPRPDTETLVEAVLDWCGRKEKLRILDLCTGSGCIALALKQHLPHAQVYAVDCSKEALAYAEKNKAYHQLDVHLYEGDVLDTAFRDQFYDIPADVIVSNPPYLDDADMKALQTEVRYEPKEALFGGKNGLLYYPEVTHYWKKVLRSGGLLAYEIGETQGKEVSEIMEDNGFRNVRIIKDYAGNDRVVLGERRAAAPLSTRNCGNTC